MDKVHADLSPPALVSAFESNLAGFIGKVAALSGAQIHYADEITWGVTDINFPILNAAIRIRLSSDRADSEIKDAVTRARDKQISIMWFVSPETTPDDLSDRLFEHGFTGPGEMPGMAIDLTVLDDELHAPSGITIKQVVEQSDLDVYMDIFHASFGMPEKVSTVYKESFIAAGLEKDHPLRHFLALRDGHPVAISSVYFEAGIAGIYNVATLESERGRGIGSAMTAYPLHLAQDMGYHVGALQSSEIGFNVYRQLGFEQICTFYYYVWQPD